MKKIIAAVIAFAVIAVPQTQVNAENSANELKVARLPEELTPEDVYAYLWDQTVVTVSRREQKISEAPASVTVITADDIKRSGALNIHDVLRPVVGLDVVTLTQTFPAISMRGFNTALVSRTMLVLINGNPIYLEGNMSPFWNVIPLTLEEVERIEIVRGPGSALWGANAYSGIINIITKSPDKFPEFQVRQSAGEIGTTFTNIIHAHKTGDMQYRLQYSHEQMGNITLNPNDTSRRRNIYTFDLRYKTPANREMSLLFSYGHPLYTIINPLFNMVERSFFKEFIHLTYKTDNSWIKIRQIHTETEQMRQGFPYVPAIPNPLNEDAVSVELQTTKQFQRLGTLTYGTEYKFVSGLHFGPRRTQGLGSLFAQEDIHLNEKLSLNLGARVDTHPQVKTAFSPRISVMYSPVAKHTWRVTGATSYRRPSYTELYANALNQVLSPPSVIRMLGDENIKAEKIQSIETGYVGRLTERLKLSANVYRNILDNFINLIPIGGGQFRFVNRNKATQNGAEVELETVFAKNLKGFVNYAFNQTKNTQTGGPFDMSPKHKANTGIGWLPNRGLYGNLVFNYVDDTGQTLGTQGFKRIEPYRNLDINLGYRFNRKLEGLELGLNVQNVFNKKRKEHPAGDTVKRRVVGTVSYAF